MQPSKVDPLPGCCGGTARRACTAPPGAPRELRPAAVRALGPAGGTGWAPREGEDAATAERVRVSLSWWHGEPAAGGARPAMVLICSLACKRQS